MNSINKRIAIITSIITLFILGMYFYLNNSSFKSAANEFIANNITGKELPPAVAKIKYQNWIYFIADGTGDCYISYNIPKVEIDHLSKAADLIHKSNGGRLWLSYVDNNSKNNNCLYFNIPASLSKLAKPISNSGETPFEYSNRVKQWEKLTSSFSVDSLKNENNYNLAKEKFLKSCELLLSQRVYKQGLKENNWSDIIGGINSAISTFDAISDTTPGLKYIVAYSDLQQDTPHLTKPQLKEIPKELKLIAVNPAPGSSTKCTDKVTEVEVPERVFEIIFKN